MHETSFLKSKKFSEWARNHYSTEAKSIKVLDIGSCSYEGQHSHRELFSEKNRFEYTGLDIVDGHNVDIVPADKYLWREIENETFDLCISGQTFEHNPFFWITFSEIARVLKQGGVAMIIAPGGGRVHRYPMDCWRFYPDSWQALCDYTGMQLLESLFEERQFQRVGPGYGWIDSSAILAKPKPFTAADSDRFYRRLAAIAATAPNTLDNRSAYESVYGNMTVLHDYDTERKGSRMIRKLLSRAGIKEVLRGAI